MRQPRQILAAAANLEAFGRVEELVLESSEARIDVVRDGTAALEAAKRNRFDLILTEFPLPEFDLSSFLEQLRKPRCRSMRSSVLVLAGSVARAELEESGTADRPGVEICCSTRQTLRAVSEFLNLTDRVSAELRVRVSATTECTGGVRIWKTQNISPSGMLLTGDEALPVGGVFPICIELPEDEPMVHGRGEIVRHAEAHDQGQVDMGLRFVQLFGNGGERLADYVHTELAFERLRTRHLH